MAGAKTQLAKKELAAWVRRVNYRFFICAVVGVSMVFISSMLQTYEIAKRNSALKKTSTRYRAFSYNHQEVAIAQNALALARIGKFFSPESTRRYIAASEPAFKEAMELHLETCKTVLGNEEFNKTIAEGGPLPTATDPLPLHNRSLSGLTLLTYLAMNHELADEFKSRDMMRLWFLLLYVIGTGLVLVGSLRRAKDGSWALGSILKWVGGALLLGGWVFQSFLADKWSTREEFINEAIFEAAALHTTNLLYEESSILRIEEQHAIDVSKQVHTLAYLMGQFRFTNEMLFSLLSVDEQRPLSGKLAALGAGTPATPADVFR